MTRPYGRVVSNLLRHLSHTVSILHLMKAVSLQEPCRYCGEDCPNDEDHACDGYLGDIDNLYQTHSDQS